MEGKKVRNMYLFEHEGINVYIEDGKVIVEDDQERQEYLDTEENRIKCIAQAKEIVAEWENGR